MMYKWTALLGGIETIVQHGDTALKHTCNPVDRSRRARVGVYWLNR